MTQTTSGDIPPAPEAEQGNLLTGPGRLLPANQHITTHLALFEDGTVYLVESASQDEAIIAFLKAQREQGRTIKPATMVEDVEAIRAIYKAAAARELAKARKTNPLDVREGTPALAETQAGDKKSKGSFFSKLGFGTGKAGETIVEDAPQENADDAPAPIEERPVQTSEAPRAAAKDKGAGKVLEPFASDEETPLVMEREPDSPEAIQARILNSKLKTGVKGGIGLSQVLMNSLALFEDGTLYVVQGQQNNNHVVSFIEGQRMLGTRIVRLSPISFRQLQHIYSEAGEGDGEGSKDEKTSADKQKEFLEIVRRAALLGASDVHLTLWPTSMSVEFRVDGVIEKVGEMGYNDGRSLLIAAYNMSDVSGVSHQMLQYQEARISSYSAALPSALQALRLQFNPLVFRGRILIVRLLYSETKQEIKHLGDLGWNQEQQNSLTVARQQVNGVSIISGPTGSGKSTTLKVLLELLTREGTVDDYKERHILTVEDPPEYIIDEVHQMPVPEAETREERNLEFSKAINAALRSDPDTIVIGEIRDEESAKLAFAAAMSGHQVWTTLHANNAISIIPRLHDIGVEGYKIADPENVSALIGQRLVRRLCRECSVSIGDALKNRGIKLNGSYDAVDINALMQDIERAGRDPSSLRLASPGCDSCRGGYAGRSVVGEVILPDIAFLELAAQGKMVETQRYWREEMKGRDYKDHAMDEVEAGVIDTTEYERWCGPVKQYADRFTAKSAKTKIQVVASTPPQAERAGR